MKRKMMLQISTRWAEPQFYLDIFDEIIIRYIDSGDDFINVYFANTPINIHYSEKQNKKYNEVVFNETIYRIQGFGIRKIREKRYILVSVERISFWARTCPRPGQIIQFLVNNRYDYELSNGLQLVSLGLTKQNHILHLRVTTAGSHEITLVQKKNRKRWRVHPPVYLIKLFAVDEFSFST